MQDIELDDLEVHLYNQIFHSVPDESEQNLSKPILNSIPNSQENNSDLSNTRKVSNYIVNNKTQKNKNRYWAEPNQPINIVKHIISDLVPQISNENENENEIKTVTVGESLSTELSNGRTVIPLEKTVVPLENTVTSLETHENIQTQNNHQIETTKNYNTKKRKEKKKNRKKKNKDNKKKINFNNPFEKFHSVAQTITGNLNNYRNHSCLNCITELCCKCNTFQSINGNNLIFQNIFPTNKPECVNTFNKKITIGLPPIITPYGNKKQKIEINDSKTVELLSIDSLKHEDRIELKSDKKPDVVVISDDSDNDSVEIIENPQPIVVVRDSDSECENLIEKKNYRNPFAINKIENNDTETLNIDLNKSSRIENNITSEENPNNVIPIGETSEKSETNNIHNQDGLSTLTEMERFEMLQTPDSSVNDFIDNDISVDKQFNFNLHGSDLDLTEKEFVRPSKVYNNDIYETESSCSGTGTPTKPTYNILHNTPIKEIFQESDLLSFSNFITPNRDKGVKRKNTEELEQVKTKASEKKNTTQDETKNDNNNELKKNKKKDKKNKNKDNDEIQEQKNNTKEFDNEISEPKDKKIKNKEECNNESSKKNSDCKDKKNKNKEEFNVTNKILETKEIIVDTNEILSTNPMFEKRKKSLDKQFEKKKRNLLKKKYYLDEKIYRKKLEKIIHNYKQRLGKLGLKAKINVDNILGEDDADSSKLDCDNSFNITINDESLNSSNILDQTETISDDDSHQSNEIDRVDADSKIIFADDNSFVFTHDESEDNTGSNDIVLNINNEEKYNQENLIPNNGPSTSKDGGCPNFKKRFKDFWTPDMETFYDKSWGEEFFNLDKVMQSMTTDSSKWKIIDEDRMITTTRRKYCVVCKKTGHFKFDCTQLLRKDIKCSTCGHQGHFHMRCPNLLCTSCGHKGGYFTTSCHRCAHFSRINCYICKMVGHPANLCPDLWRRYHLTTNEDLIPPLTTSKLKPIKEQWCSGCARRGHLHHNCLRVTRDHFPTLPNIVSYERSYVNNSIPPLLLNSSTEETRIPSLNNISLGNLTKYKNTIVNNNSKKYLFVIRSLIRLCQREPTRQFLPQIKNLERDILENRFDSKKIGLMYKLKSTICKLCN